MTGLADLSDIAYYVRLDSFGPLRKACESSLPRPLGVRGPGFGGRRRRDWGRRGVGGSGGGGESVRRGTGARTMGEDAGGDLLVENEAHEAHAGGAAGAAEDPNRQLPAKTRRRS